MMIQKNLLFSFMLLLSMTLVSQEKYPFQDSNFPIEGRIDDLISRLSLEEKASLMLYTNPAIERLGIPEYNWWNESLHGIGRAGKATVFPQAIGLAASFDKDLLFQVASIISDEARAKHQAALAIGSHEQYTGLTFWSPNVNIFRDPRWGRGQETYGEDPYLTSKLAIAYVKGMQGDDPNYLKTSACAKHFVVHSGPEESRHRFNAYPDEVDFRETYLPAFKALVDNGVESVMCAYNRLYGEACCGSPYLLNSLLREEWGFKGHIVTDCWAIDDIWLRHQITDDPLVATAMAMDAGSNLNCGSMYNNIVEVVKKGLVKEERVNELLRPLLRTRMKLGLLGADKNAPYQHYDANILGSEEHRKAALLAAQKSMVLLKNEHQVLPLKSEDLHKIYVTGPTANDLTVLLGNYNGLNGTLVSFLEGIVNRANPGTVVEFNQGSLLTGNMNFNGIYHAGSSDAIIACVGNSRFLEGEDGDALLNDHGGDRIDIRLPENQMAFLRKLKEAAGEKPLILVVTGGSAIALGDVKELADVIIFAWYPGQEGGNALASILFGDYNPSGRLPVTFYKSVNDLPDFDDYHMDDRTYRFFKKEALYEFGYGLSYADFGYSNLRVIQDSNDFNEEIEIRFTLKNNSNIDGEEVVQLYVKEESDRLKNPLKSLKGFQRVFLKAAEEKEVVLRLPIDDLAHWDIESQSFVIQNNGFELQIGSSSKNIRLRKTIKRK